MSELPVNRIHEAYTLLSQVETDVTRSYAEFTAATNHLDVHLVEFANRYDNSRRVTARSQQKFDQLLCETRGLFSRFAQSVIEDDEYGGPTSDNIHAITMALYMDDENRLGLLRHMTPGVDDDSLIEGFVPEDLQDLIEHWLYPDGFDHPPDYENLGDLYADSVYENVKARFPALVKSRE